MWMAASAQLVNSLSTTQGRKGGFLQKQSVQHYSNWARISSRRNQQRSSKCRVGNGSGLTEKGKTSMPETDLHEEGLSMWGASLRMRLVPPNAGRSENRHPVWKMPCSSSVGKRF